MDRRTMLKSSAAVVAATSLPALSQTPQGPAALNALFDQFMKENLDLSPTTSTSLGLDTGERAHQKSEIDDSSEKGVAAGKALTASQLARLQAFDASSVTGADRVNYEVVLYGLRNGDAANKRFQYGTGNAGSPYVISQLTGNYSQIPSFLDNQHTIETQADAEAYLQRLQAFATSMDQEIEVARHDMALGVIPPDFAVAKTLTQMQALRQPSPEDSSLTESVVRRTKERGIAGDYSGRAAALVKNQVYPALDRQIALVREMQKRATHDAGVSHLPDGAEYYRDSLIFWATTDRKAQEIHQLGLDLVKEHTARIDALMHKLGNTQGTVGQRLRKMFEDASYQYPNTDEAKEELLKNLNTGVQKVRAKLPQWFGALPKADVVIKRVPKAIEAGQPGGYYNAPSLDGKRPGIYWINLRDASEHPKWTLPTLTYHESIPGHHLQLSIQQEAGLPLIRKVSFFSAYMEGWALYAEQLASEMGMYADDPLGQIGQLQASMFRCVRLVLDTGLHTMRWSREQAVKYYTDTLGDKEAAAITEVERYCVWPGQACTYMLGKLTFLAQRSKAQAKLGTGFDIRKFHDTMLLSGAVPLAVLDTLYAQTYGA